MNGKAFIDSNVLVYAVDRNDPQRRRRARALLAETGGRGVVSTQVLQEFFVAATRKLGVEALKAKDVIRSAREAFEVVTISPELIDRAIDQSVLLQVSFWDALILSAAENSACAVLLSEDVNPGQRYAGVRVENPFRAPA